MEHRRFMTIELTEQEANTLIALINEAVKSKGLDAAQAGVYFQNKLKEAFKAQGEKVATDPV